jgi:hypothetical protein
VRSPPGLAGIPSRPGKGLSGFPDGQGLAEMPRGEPRDLAGGLAGLVQFPEAELEDVRAFRGHLQGHINVVPGGVSGQPDGLVTVVCFRRSSDPRAVIQRTWPVLRGTWWPGGGRRPACHR